MEWKQNQILELIAEMLDTKVSTCTDILMYAKVKSNKQLKTPLYSTLLRKYSVKVKGRIKLCINGFVQVD